jgi:uncharacterized protein (DUF1810 family)
MADPHHLQRFVDAQASVHERVLAELRVGAKTSHWMWFIFPQLKGLGLSATSQYFGIASLPEAEAYWQHPVLGARIRECTELVLAAKVRTAHEIFGSPDDLKLRSSLTLFELAAPNEAIFGQTLDKYFNGERDAATLRLLALHTDE